MMRVQKSLAFGVLLLAMLGCSTLSPRRSSTNDPDPTAVADLVTQMAAANQTAVAAAVTPTPAWTSTPDWTPTPTYPPNVTPEPRITLSDGTVLAPLILYQDYPDQGYFTTISRPVMQGDSPRAAAFNQKVEAVVVSELASFQTGLADLGPNQDPNPWFFGVSYNIIRSNANLLSIRLLYSFYTGGAHPGSYHSGITYDLAADRFVELADLFNPGSDYLGALSEACIAELRNRQDMLFPDFESGAAPTPDNYRVWNLAPDGLLVTFEEYQVAPYAAGPQEVLVPYAALSGQMRPEWAARLTEK